jgi:ABC-type amino acid transport substrate-binding protein
MLGLPYQPTAFDSPNAGIKALRDGLADVTFLAPTPERVGLIDFAPAFMEMEITLIVAGDSPIKTLADADQPGRKIVVYEKTANDETARKALTRRPSFMCRCCLQRAFEMIKAGEADAFVDLRDQLASHQGEFPGSRVVPGALGRNAMAIGTVKERPAAAAYVQAFTGAAIKSGFVTKSIDKAGVRGAVTPGM